MATDTVCINISCLRIFPILLALTMLSTTGIYAGTYEQKKAIHDTLFSSSKYSPVERPVRDQSQIMTLGAVFELVSIVEVNDVIQSFKCNGFLAMHWYDELLQWNASDYGGIRSITPKVTSVFRPLMVLLNTLGDRDLFEDDHAPLLVFSNGLVTWTPGSIFPTSCKLDLTKFPYDKQHCEIQMVIMNYGPTEIVLSAYEPNVGMAFFIRNGLWEITNHSLTAPLISVRDDKLPSFLVSFDLKRKPTFLIISILLPTVFMSLLNLLVFVIPVDSGEKITYGITVLLALTVFMSILSGMLPTSSESMPLVIYYIFSLLTISVLTVVDSVIIVRLHHMEEREEKSQKARANFKSIVPKIGLLRSAAAPLVEGHSSSELQIFPTKPVDANPVQSLKRSKTYMSNFGVSKVEPTVNRYKVIGKYIDLVSLIVFGVVWVMVTIGFMAAIAA